MSKKKKKGNREIDVFEGYSDSGLICKKFANTYGKNVTQKTLYNVYNFRS